MGTAPRAAVDRLESLSYLDRVMRRRRSASSAAGPSPERATSDGPIPCGSVDGVRAGLLARAGVRDDIARDVADVLVDGDLLGHTTHGLALLPGYLGELEQGTMRKDGAPTVVSARPAAQTWDGHRLPGRGSRCARSTPPSRWRRTQGTGTSSVRRSHHIACLAAYLKRATDRGLMLLLVLLGSVGASVAPFGGVSPVFTPNPLAAGIPTSRRADPARRLGELHHQRPHRAPASRRARSCRIRGSRTRAASPPPIPRCCSTSRRARCCRSADSKRATRATRSRCWSRR